MADYGFNTNLGPQAQAGMSLGDMINLARGAQAYQQQQQLNPLQLRQEQAKTKLAEETLQPEIEQKKATSQKSQLELNIAKRVEASRIAGASATDRTLIDMINKNDVNGITEYFDNRRAELERGGFSKSESLAAISPLVVQAHKDPSKIIPSLELLSKQSVSPADQVSLFTPQLTTNAAGALVGANPVTNRVNVLGEGGQAGAGQNVGGQNVNPNFNVGSNPTSFSIGATKEQATQAINDYLGSLNAMSDTTKVGHIPTQEMVAKKLLTYLKDPAVDTGPIADVLAGKTNQATLTAKQQEVVKLIQQRIQNLNPRTDADAQSKKDAYGSFRLKKDALMDLIRQDLGGIQNQKLLATGLVNSAGSPNNPNLPAVTAFKQKYGDYSKDQALMQYIGIVGTGQKAAIDEEDKNALRKLIKTFGLSDLSSLEEKRKELVNLTGAK